MPVKRRGQKGKHNIKSVVRVRPRTKIEEEMGIKTIVCCYSSKEVMVREKRFQFDRVYSAETDQLEIYQTTIAPLVRDVLIEGFNCTIFAYGQTGSGKTYTMNGDNSQCPSDWKKDISAGCIPRVAAHLFEMLQQRRLSFNVTVSYLELYNEEIRDLLRDDYSTLPIYNDAKNEIFIQGLSENSVVDQEQLCQLLQRGNLKKQMAATLLNYQSSRSHTVFTITVHTREITRVGDDILRTGKLNLVDLAGSENIARSGCKNVRARELSNINRSLLTLGRVINALSVKGQLHVPYRDSKLTRILQDSLGGRTKTCIIATVSPTAESHDETLNTLDYACRARAIRNTPVRNEKFTRDEMMQGLLHEIDKLKKDLDAVRNKSGFYIDKDNYTKLLESMEMLTGEKVSIEELIRKEATRVEQLEQILKVRTKEFDEAVLMCKQSVNVLARAKKRIKEKSSVLKQEQFVAQAYQAEASDLHKAAEELLHTSRDLSAERRILQEKLNKQYSINLANQIKSQTAVTEILGKLADLDRESNQAKLSDKIVSNLCKQDMIDLRTELQESVNELNKLLALVKTFPFDELFSKNELIVSMNEILRLIKEECIKLKARLDYHFNCLDQFLVDFIEPSYNDYKILTHRATYLVNSLADNLHGEVAVENKTLKKKMLQLEKSLMTRKVQDALITEQKKDLDTKIDKIVKEIKTDFLSKDYSRRGDTLFTDLIDTTSRSEATTRSLINNIEQTLQTDFISLSDEIQPQTILTTVSDLVQDVEVLSAKFDIIHSQNLDFAEPLTPHINDIGGQVDQKMKTMEVRLEFFIDDLKRFEGMFENFVEKTNRLLTEEFLDRMMFVSREDDTPSQSDAPAQGDVPAHVDAPAQGDALAQGDEPAQGDQSAQGDEPAQGGSAAQGDTPALGDVSPHGLVVLHPLAQRATLVESFKQQQSLHGGTSTSGSELDLGCPTETGANTPPET